MGSGGAKSKDGLAMQTVDRERLDVVFAIAGLNWSNQDDGIESK